MKNQTRRIRRSVNQRRLTKRKSFKQEGGAGDKGIAFFATRAGGKLKKFGTTKEVFVVIGLNTRHDLSYYEMDVKQEKFKIDRLQKQTAMTDFKLLKNFVYHYYGDEGSHPKRVSYFAQDPSDLIGKGKNIDLKIPIEIDGSKININDVTFTLSNPTLAMYVHFLLMHISNIAAQFQVCDAITKGKSRVPHKIRTTESFKQYIDFFNKKRAKIQGYYEKVIIPKHMLIIPKMNALIDEKNKFGLGMKDAQEKLSAEAGKLIERIKGNPEGPPAITFEEISQEPDPDVRAILKEAKMEAEFDEMSRKLRDLEFRDLEERLARLRAPDDGSGAGSKEGGGTRRRKRRLSNKKKRSTRRRHRKMVRA